MAQEEEANEHYRIHVPNPDCEIIVGEGPSGFIGVMQRVSYGGMFFGAGGYGFGIGSADSSYEGFRKAHTSLSIGISALQLVGQFMRAFTLGRDANVLSVTVNALAFGLGPLASTVGAITSNGLTTPQGTICMYAEKTVALASPLSVNLTSGVAASVSGGVAASLNGVVSATVNGAVAGVFGSYSATVSGMQTRIVGDAETSVSARNGKLTVEGNTVQIGARSGIVPGTAYWAPGAGTQYATSSVEIQADSEITLAPGSGPERLTSTKTKLVASKAGIHAQGKDAALTLEDYAVMRVGGAALAMIEDEIKLFVSPIPFTAAFDAATQAAEVAWVAETKAADALTTAKQEVRNTQTVVGTALSIIGAGIALGTARGSENEKAGVAMGAMAGGAVVGVLGVAALFNAVEDKLTQAAREAARKIADAKLRMATYLLRDTVKETVSVAAELPTNPNIGVTTDAVTINVGLSKIKVTQTGIVMTSPPGMSITVNGQEFKRTIPGLLAVG